VSWTGRKKSKTPSSMTCTSKRVWSSVCSVVHGDEDNPFGGTGTATLLGEGVTRVCEGTVTGSADWSGYTDVRALHVIRW